MITILAKSILASYIVLLGLNIIVEVIIMTISESIMERSDDRQLRYLNDRATTKVTLLPNRFLIEKISYALFLMRVNGECKRKKRSKKDETDKRDKG